MTKQPANGRALSEGADEGDEERLRETVWECPLKLWEYGHLHYSFISLQPFNLGKQTPSQTGNLVFAQIQAYPATLYEEKRRKAWTKPGEEGLEPAVWQSGPASWATDRLPPPPPAPARSPAGTCGGRAGPLPLLPS